MKRSVDSWRRITESSALAGIAAALLVLLLVRLGVLRSAGRLGFMLVLGSIVLANIFWWSWVRRHLAGDLRSQSRGGRLRRLLGFAWTAYCLFMLLPFVLILFRAGAYWDALRVPILAWTLIWHLLLAVLGGVAAIVAVIHGTVRLVRGHRSRQALAQTTMREGQTAGANEPCPGANARMTRRRLLAGAAAAAPLVISGGGTLAGRRQEGRFLCREITLCVPRLPERLRGLTITQVSDLHVGRFFRPEHLPRVVDAANKFRSDILAVTGDIIDHSNDYLPAVQEALARIEAPYGRYVVIGNHDLIDDADALVSFLAGREPHLLCDRLERVNIGGEVIQIAGLFWSRQEHPGPGDRLGITGRAARTLAGGEPGRFTIALAHHPHAFDALAAGGADLVLAGHTHGGQIMLTPPGTRPRLGAGNLLFRYIYGEYAIGNARMYVNAGVGNWLPLRINAPAEIVKIRLT